jgi:hypothetical protein
MSSSTLIPAAPESELIDRELLVAKLNKALYPIDRQEKFLELQAEVETLLSELQSLQRVDLPSAGHK